MSRKHRADSNLKTLPEELQEEIITRLNAKGGSYKAITEWLRAEMDVPTSIGALSEFYSWRTLRSQVREAESDTQSLQEALSASEFGLSSGQIQELGNLMFITKATKQADAKTFVAMAKLLIQKQKLEVDSRKVALLEQKAAQADAAAGIAKDGTLTKEDKQQRIFEIFGK